jgi:hypothetical protein
MSPPQKMYKKNHGHPPKNVQEERKGDTSMFSGGIVLEAVRLSSTAPATIESRARSASSSPVRCCLETGYRTQVRQHVTGTLKLLFDIFQYFGYLQALIVSLRYTFYKHCNLKCKICKATV